MDNSISVFQWFERLESDITRTEKRSVILLIDNCSPHGTANIIPTLTSVKVISLPPNTTSEIQQLDAGIVPVMKVKSFQKKIERVLDLVDLNVRDIYKLDEETGMKWVTKVWIGMLNRTIQNRWRSNGLFDEKLQPALEKYEMKEVENLKKEF